MLLMGEGGIMIPKCGQTKMRWVGGEGQKNPMHRKKIKSN